MFCICCREYSDGDEDGRSLSPAMPSKKSKYVPNFIREMLLVLASFIREMTQGTSS